MCGSSSYRWSVSNSISMYTEDGFGKGRSNTKEMLNREGRNSNTIWGVINGNTGEEREDGPEWFVPSKEELAAFSEKFNISDSASSDTYYGNLNLSGDYWSSSQRNTEFAYDASFKDSSLGSDNLYTTNYVRLATTF